MSDSQSLFTLDTAVATGSSQESIMSPKPVASHLGKRRAFVRSPSVSRLLVLPASSSSDGEETVITGVSVGARYQATLPVMSRAEHRVPPARDCARATRVRPLIAACRPQGPAPSPRGCCSHT